jgi:dTDP-4-dehydrorhamnose reductase/SAM-dependent methyltransferase
MKILLIGGSGLLGTELKKLHPIVDAPTRDHLDIGIGADIRNFLHPRFREIPDIIINAAAIKDNRKIEQDPSDAIATNIIGAANIAQECSRLNIRYIYISTDYVYGGSRGNYKETDEIDPQNLYAWTKLGGESSARAVKNHLIIRTSFGSSEFDYPEAFSDKWSSKDYVDVIAPMILEASVSPLTGVVNIGTERKTIFDHASRRNPLVKPIKLSESSHSTPYDTSLNLQKWFDYKSSKPIATPHAKCRCCRSEKLTKYLDLGLMPLANNLEISSVRGKMKERFPLQVMFCQDCGLSQLSLIIDPEKMFSYYTYRSSVNGGYIKHCNKMAYDLRLKYGLSHDSLVVDIAGNDGTLLNEFRKVIADVKVVNVDPASNLAAISEAQGIETIVDFWGISAVDKILEKHGYADLITATNVFAHVDDIDGFVLNAKIALKPDGILVIECPYLVDFIENFEFDTVYFEHLSYMSVLPINHLCVSNGMKIISVERQAIHGGTIRVTIAKETSSLTVEQSVFTYVDQEQKKGFQSIEVYKKWADDVKKVIDNFGSSVLNLKKEGNKIAAFAASAKGNTLLNSARINTDIIDYICDQTPEKVGKFSPGTGIPIVHRQELQKNPPDYLILLSWNFSEELMQKAKEVGYKGKYIIPIPEFTILD